MKLNFLISVKFLNNFSHFFENSSTLFRMKNKIGDGKFFGDENDRSTICIIHKEFHKIHRDFKKIYELCGNFNLFNFNF